MSIIVVDGQRFRIFRCQTCTHARWTEVVKPYGEHKFENPSIETLIDSELYCSTREAVRTSHNCDWLGNDRAEDRRCMVCKYGQVRLLAAVKRTGKSKCDTWQTLIMCTHPEKMNPGTYRTIYCTCDNFVPVDKVPEVPETNYCEVPKEDYRAKN